MASYKPQKEVATFQLTLLHQIIGKSTGSWTYIDPEVKEVEGKLKANWQTTLMHELSHAHDKDQGRVKNQIFNTSSADKPTEIRAVHRENLIRNKIGFQKRETYSGEKINWKLLKK